MKDEMAAYVKRIDVPQPMNRHPFFLLPVVEKVKNSEEMAIYVKWMDPHPFFLLLQVLNFWNAEVCMACRFQRFQGQFRPPHLPFLLDRTYRGIHGVLKVQG